MPNPELSQYHDHDTNTVYDLKDTQSRERITELEKYPYKIVSVYTMVGGGYTQDHRGYIFDIYHRVNDSYFTRNYDGSCIRCIFPPQTLDYDPDADLYFSTGVYQEQRIMPVYKDVDQTTLLQWGDVNGLVVDFVFRVSGDTGYFVVLSSPSSVNASNVLYDNAISGLSAGNVQDAIDEVNAEKIGDNPTFTEAATRQNIASGETFAVILGKIKKFFSDLKAVAFSGSYNDLTDTPTIPAAQVQSDWTQSNSGAVDYIKNKPTLATVATSGNYNDLDYKPTFSAGTGINIRGSGVPGYDWDYEIEFTGDADEVDYDNSVSGLSATNVEQAIDELAAEKADASSLATVATTGDYDSLTNKPTIPAAQVQSDWTQADNTEVDYIKNKPNLAAVATSGDYGDLSGTPNLATVATTGDYDDLINKRPSDYSGNTTASAVPVQNSTSYTELLTVALTKGTWLINWAASFPSAGSSNTGYRAAGLTTSSTGDPYAYMMQQVPAVSNNTFTCLSGSCIYDASGSVTMRLKARQYQGTSGSALNVSPRLQAIRLL